MSDTQPPSSSPDSTPATTGTVTNCPACAATVVAGSLFCASCGTTLGGTACNECRAPLTPGAKFCHRCGTAVGSTVGTLRARGGAPGATAHGSAPRSDRLAWGLAAVALLTVVALVAGQNFRAQRGGSLDAPSNALPQAGLDDRGAAVGPGAGQAGPMPDLTTMSPAEQANRLFNRIMRYSAEGKQDSAQFFAPMAMQVLQAIPNPTLDDRYHLGLVGEASGDFTIAKAQADTILLARPTHLLALALRARMSPAAAERRAFEQRMLAAEAAERSAALPEYVDHAVDVDSSLARARRGGTP